ncbi:MAG TPA: phosphoadenylyl-sulfate reductase [Bryobacteraceae bacterium]|nr:phosphoadenylyl-sulfate reductase [Bryobacteraceae bacterium]
MPDILAPARSIIAEALAGGAPACVTCSFQSEDVALVHLLLAQRPSIDVLFLDTGYHFPEVYEYRDRIAAQFGIAVQNLMPAQTVPEQESQFGILYQSDPSRCCHLRKVVPLMDGLSPYKLWFTGLRREQSPTRANLQPVESHKFPNGLALIKVSPLFDWTTRDVEAYLAANDIPRLPLYDAGYTSIGCQPCTAISDPAEHARSGRWGGRKLECGLHTVTEKEG